MSKLFIVCLLAVPILGYVPMRQVYIDCLQDPTVKIVGGECASIEKYPYQLSLISSGSHMCGAAIISENFALTAAHCTYGSLPSELSVRAGSDDRTNGGVIHIISQIIVHENYTPKKNDYDISLLKVKAPFIYGIKVQPIALPEPGDDVKDGTEVDVSGWGTTSSGGMDLPKHLLHVNLHIVNQEECAAVYEGITDRMLCASDDGKDTCQGDSGGPLVQNGKLVGIVSFGHGCAQFLFPGVYARVSALRDWIKDNSGI